MSLRRFGCLKKLMIPVQRGPQVLSPILKPSVPDHSWKWNIQLRNASISTKSFEKKTGLIQGFFENIKTQFQKYRLRATGFHLYECVADNVDHMKFMKELRMPDTFSSWFLVTELHVWMLMAMLMGEPKYGRFLRNCIVEAMWEDVTTRAKKLGTEHLSIVRSQIRTLSEEFQAALVSYDEGLLSSDTVLAGAIWRRLLVRDPSCTAKDLEAVVKYIRKSMVQLDSWDLDTFISEKKIHWVPISEIFGDLTR
ncbi:ubiquinol-cytochrome c reductase complex assembly factor 1 isoform X1 [Rhodnius prolixus]